MDDIEGIIGGLLAAERYNDQFRKPNRNGRYPVCEPRVGTTVCERCQQDLSTIPIAQRGPCPVVPRERRWGENWPK